LVVGAPATAASRGRNRTNVVKRRRRPTTRRGSGRTRPRRSSKKSASTGRSPLRRR